MKRRKRRKRRIWDRKSSRPKLQNLLAKADSYLGQNRPDKAMEVLKQVPARYHKNNEYRYLHGVCSLAFGEHLQAIEDLEAALTSEPKETPLYFQLALAYLARTWFRHALLYAERYLQSSFGVPMLDERAREIIAETRSHIAAEALALNTQEDLLMRALLPHERAQRELAWGRYKQAIKECDTAIRLVQNWPSPRNNKALALFYAGNVSEAIRTEETVLDTLDANNLHALGNLVSFHFSLLNEEVYRQYGERFRQVVEAKSYDNLDLNKIIETFAILEDAESLWSIAQYAAPFEQESLHGESWYILGAAAANLGHAKEARRLLNNAQEMSAHPSTWVEEGLRALKGRNRQVEGFSLRGRFPYLQFTHYFPQTLLTEFAANQPENDEKAMREIGRMLKRFPYIAGAFKLILWDEQAPGLRLFALNALATMDDPKAWEQLLAFGSSQFGTNEQRTAVLRYASEADMLDPTTPFRFWDERSGEWREVVFTMQEIAEPEEPTCNEQALKWMERALTIAPTSAGMPSERQMRKAITYYQRAVEADPTCAAAWHNMGAQYINLGEKEKGEALIKRSIEIDPDYLFAYTSLATIAYQRGDYEAAKEVLFKVNTAKLVQPEVNQHALALQFWIALKEDEIDIAKNTVELIESIYEDHPELENMKRVLALRELTSSWQIKRDETVHRYHQRKLKQAIAADESLTACLNRNSREALVGTLRAWRSSTSGRKAEVIERLATPMLDEDMLAYFIPNKLSEQETEALRWLLEQGGIRPWLDFTQRFGDDFDESPYWQWHEPETVPGRLRMLGLLAVGTLNHEQVALIPYELRTPLARLVSP